MWEEEHPPIGFRNANESIIFAQFTALGIASSWVLGSEHTMAITMLTVVGVLTLILYFNHAQHGLFEHRRSARRFWLLLLPVLYAICTYVLGQFWPVLQTVVVGNESFMILTQQPALVPVSTITSLGWPMLAYGCGIFIASIGLLCLVRSTFLFWKLLWVLAISASALAAVGWLFWLIGASRLYFFITPPQETFFATFTHPHHWAIFALVWSVVLGGLILQKKAQRDWADFFADKGLLLIIAFAALLGSVIPSGAPAHHAVAGLLLVFFIALIAIDQWQKKSRVASLLFGLFGLALAAFSIQLLAGSLFAPPEVSAPLGIALSEQRNLWQDAWELFLARPLFGWGDGGFAAVHPFVQSTDLEAYRYNAPMSDLLLALANKGILGTLIACVVPAGVFIAFIRLKKHKDLSYCLLLAPAIIALFALVSNPLQSPPLLLSFYLLLISAYQWSRLDIEQATPTATRLIPAEATLKNTANSRKQKTIIKPFAAPAKSSVSRLPEVSETEASEVADGASKAATAPHTPPVAEAPADVGGRPPASQSASQATPLADAHFDFIVIGGGSAGYAAANLAQRAGNTVAIIDAAKELGGLCILHGCMPSKTLIYSTEVLHLAQKSARLGLNIPQASVDMTALHARKKRVIAEFADYRRSQIESGRFQVYRQRARFTGKNDLILEDGTTLSAKKILIATGSKVSVPSIEGLVQTPFWTSDDVLELDFVPKSVIVLGGGVVACELAQFLRRIGAEVTLIQRSARVLKEQSAQASAVIEKAFADEGIEVLTETELERIEQLADSNVKVTFNHNGERKERIAEHLFNALGRTPNTDGLDLEAAGVTTRKSGHIITSAFQQTTNPAVYAAGDVAGPHEIVHVAILQAEVAARHAFNEPCSPVDTAALTGVIFTDPQIARVGPQEEALSERGIETLSADYPFDDHGKSILMEAKYGYVKTIVNKADGRLLAAECVGRDASELIHSMAVAVSLKARASDLLCAHWYHPTLSEIWTYPLEDCVDALKADPE